MRSLVCGKIATQGRCGRHVASFTYRVLLVCSLVSLAIAGESGGVLTHGSKFMAEYAPTVIKNWLGENEPEVAVKPGDATSSATWIRAN